MPGRYLHAELGGVAYLVDDPRRADQALRRYAPDVEAVAAHQVLLDERYLGAEPGGRRRGDQPGGARADDHQVVATRWRRVAVRFRMNVVQQRLVVGIEWRDQRRRSRLRFTHVAQCNHLVTHRSPP